MPSSPSARGRARRQTKRNTKVRKKEIMADTRPSEKAVNIAEAKIFTPVTRKLRLNRVKPCLARAKTSVSGPAKTRMMREDPNSARANTSRDTTPMTQRQILKIFFS